MLRAIADTIRNSQFAIRNSQFAIRNSKRSARDLWRRLITGEIEALEDRVLLASVTQLDFQYQSGVSGVASGNIVAHVDSSGYNMVQIDINGNQQWDPQFDVSGQGSGDVIIPASLPFGTRTVYARAVDYMTFMMSGPPVPWPWIAQAINVTAPPNSAPTISSLDFEEQSFTGQTASGELLGTISDSQSYSASVQFDLDQNGCADSPGTIVNGIDFRSPATFTVGTHTIDARVLEYDYPTGQEIIGTWQTFEIETEGSTLNQPPLAYDDFYKTDMEMPLTVGSDNGLLVGDVDPDDDALVAILQSFPQHGTLTGLDGSPLYVGATFDGTFLYIPDAAYSGTDSFTYVADDSIAVSAPATAAIAVEERMPFKLSVYENYVGDKDVWKPNSKDWSAATPEKDGRLWNHNDHAWVLPFLADFDKDKINGIQYWAIPYANRDVIAANAALADDPAAVLMGVNAVKFGDRQEWSGDDHVTFGAPAVGDWAYLAVITYTEDGGKKYQTSTRLEFPMSSVSIHWSNRLDPNNSEVVNGTYRASGEHPALPVPGAIIFPEKATPDAEVVDDRLGVTLEVFPRVNRMLSAPLYLNISDPDNALSNINPATIKAQFDITNDEPVATATGKIQLLRNLLAIPQPQGEQLNAMPRKDLQKLSKSLQAKLRLQNEFDKNDDGLKPVANDNLDSVSGEHAPPKISHPGAQFAENGGHSLKVIIQDQVEEELPEKHEILNIFQVENPQPGNNWHVAVHDEESVVTKFDYISSDSQGVKLQRHGTAPGPEYALVASSLYTDMLTAARTLWIEHDAMGPSANQANAVLRGTFTAADDDQPELGGRAINIALLNQVLLPSLVVATILPGNYNKDSVIPFAHYTKLNDAAAQYADPFRNVRSEQAFWVVQVVSAYEGDAMKDNDADAPFLLGGWTLGYATGVAHGSDLPTYIYHEEIRDVLADGAMANKPAITFQNNATSVIVAHEVMHRFLGPHDENKDVTNQGLMNGVKAMQAPNGTDASLGVTALTGIQVQFVQTRDFPK